MLGGERQADALADFRTHDNELSLWEVRDDKSNLLDVVAAYAAGRDDLANLDYVLFKLEDVAQVVGEPIPSPEKGNTPFSDAKRWHMDLRNLTAASLCALCGKVTVAELERIERFDVRRALVERIDTGMINAGDLSEKLVAKLGV
ncbi:MAG: hypothetical protein ACYC5Q_10835 [Thermoleophilia bacterium]